MEVQGALESMAADAEGGGMGFSTHAEISQRVQRALGDTLLPADQLSLGMNSPPRNNIQREMS